MAALLPGSSGVFWIVAGLLIHAWITDFREVGVATLAGSLAAAAFAVVVDRFTGTVRSHRARTSPTGRVAALAGGLAATAWFGPVGTAMGPLVGIVIGELMDGTAASRLRAHGRTPYALSWLATWLQLVVALALGARFALATGWLAPG
ncbi:MAG TPA: DUF456 family protein [Bacillota bacterium]